LAEEFKLGSLSFFEVLCASPDPARISHGAIQHRLKEVIPEVIVAVSNLKPPYAVLKISETRRSQIAKEPEVSGDLSRER
jgi:hypothetical protein